MTKFGGTPALSSEQSIRDTNDHFLPSAGAFQTRQDAKATWVRIRNTHDQPLTVTLQGTLVSDTAWANPDSEDAFIDLTIPATTGLLNLESTFPFDLLRVKAKATDAPTTGKLFVDYMHRGT